MRIRQRHDEHLYHYEKTEERMMRATKSTFHLIRVIALIAGLTMSVAVIAWGQTGSNANANLPPTIHSGSAPEDWSHHHVVYSNLGTESESIRTGTHDRWLRVSSDPRYLMQQTRERGRRSRRGWGSPGGASGGGTQPLASKPARDWSLALGTGTVALGMSPAKFNFDVTAAITSANCTSDFVVYGLDVTGSSTQANLVGVNNLYSGVSPAGLCGLAPTVNWAYNTSTIGGGITTSPILSIDGTQVAFIESTGSNSVLHVLKWAAGDGTVGASVVPVSVASTTTCTGSCMVSLAYDPSANGTTLSSPFYNYLTDILYVGNDNGQLFEVTGVFNGTPTAGWSSSVAAGGVVMTGPVLDVVSGSIFVGGSDGVLYAVNSTTGAVQNSLAIGSTGTGGGLVDSPIVDSANGTVIAYTAANAASVGGTALALNSNAVVVQADTTTPLGSIQVAPIGLGSQGSTANLNAEAGSFDNAYFNYTSGANTGHFYQIGTTAAATTPLLYQIPFGGVSSLTLGSTGSGYSHPTISISGGGTGAVGATSGSVDGLSLTADGSGYRSIPGVSLTAAPAGGTNATATASVGLANIAVTAGGSGFTSVPAVSITGGGGGAANALLGVGTVTLGVGGTGYTSVPTVTTTGGSPTTAATLAARVGTTAVNVTTAGSGYTSFPTVTFTGGGTGSARLGVNVVTVTAGGSGYTGLPTVTFSTGSVSTALGTGALGVNTLTLSTHGAGYTSVPTVTLAGGTTTATATATLSVQTVTANGAGAGYTSVPTVTISGGGGTGATATATVGVSLIALVTATGTGTATFTGDPAGGSTSTIGGTVYTWHGSSGGCGATANCIIHGGSTTQDAENLEAAINDNAGQCGFTSGGACFYNVTAANPSASATAAGAVTTVTNKTTGSITFSTTATAHTLSPTTGSIPAPGNGSVGCTNGAAEPVTFAGAGGTGAAGTANVTGGKVTSVTLTNAGSGYTAIPLFTAPGCTTQPSETVTAKVTGVGVSANGSNFTSVPTVAFSASGATTAATATAVLGVQSLTLTTAGTGYSAIPTVAFSTSGSTTAATGTATLKVVSVSVTAAGSYTTFPTVTINGNGGSGTTATITAKVVGVTMTTQGSSTTYPIVSFTGGGGTGAAASVTAATVESVTATAPGSGYGSVPGISFTTSGSSASATATAVMEVSSVTITIAGVYTTFPVASITGGATNPTLVTTAKVVGLTAGAGGSGYGSAPSMTFSGGGGTGAVALATINVTGIGLVYGGGGYPSGAVATITDSTGTGTGATATATVNAGNVMTPGTSPTTATVTGAAGAQASPVTEMFTGTTDRLFYGFGSASGTSEVVSENVTTPGSLSAGATPYTVPSAIGGASAIIVDNLSTRAQAASIYFATRGQVASSTAHTVNVVGITVPAFSTTYTATVASGSGITNGESVTIAGALCNGGSTPPCSSAFGGASAQPNGTFTVTGITATTFTYTSSINVNFGTYTFQANTGTATYLVPGPVSYQAVKLTQSGLN